MCRAVHQRMLSFDDAPDRTQGFRKLLTGSHSGKLFALHIFRKPSFQLFHVCLWPGIPAFCNTIPLRTSGLCRIPFIVGNRKIYTFRISHLRHGYLLLFHGLPGPHQPPMDAPASRRLFRYRRFNRLSHWFLEPALRGIATGSLYSRFL